MTVVLDTSVLTRLSNPVVRAAVDRLGGAERLARAAITDLEVGFSARGPQERDALQSALSVFDHVEIGPEQFERSLEVQRLLAARGLRGRKVPDLLVAAAAEAHRFPLVHYDGDFDHIGSVTGQDVRWIVPAGSID